VATGRIEAVVVDHGLLVLLSPPPSPAECAGVPACQPVATTILRQLRLSRECASVSSYQQDVLVTQTSAEGAVVPSQSWPIGKLFRSGTRKPAPLLPAAPGGSLSNEACTPSVRCYDGAPIGLTNRAFP
jgi:hypothetical protein